MAGFWGEYLVSFLSAKDERTGRKGKNNNLQRNPSLIWTLVLHCGRYTLLRENYSLLTTLLAADKKKVQNGIEEGVSNQNSFFTTLSGLVRLGRSVHGSDHKDALE